MMNPETEGFFATLQKLRDDLDGPLSIMRRSYQELSITNRSWLPVLISRAIFGYKGGVTPSSAEINKFVAMLSNIFVIWSGYVGATLFIGFNQIFQLQWTSILTYLLPAAFFLMSLAAHLLRMLTIADPYFHIGAYSIFRKQEYRLLLTYFNSPAFSFGALNEWIGREIVDIKLERNKVIELLEDNFRRLKDEKKELLEQIELSAAKLLQTEEANRELTGLAEQMAKSIHILKIGYNRSIDLLHWMKQPAKLKPEHLHLISDFSLFTLRRNRLIKIAELGTTETPDSISIYDSAFSGYAAVKVIRNQSKMEYTESDREGRSIASYRIVMPSGIIWVYNFHFYVADPLIRGIIETQEFYRLVRIMCWLLEERSLKEDDRYVL